MRSFMLAALAALFIAGCSDSTTTPNPPSSFLTFPTTVSATFRNLTNSEQISANFRAPRLADVDIFGNQKNISLATQEFRNIRGELLDTLTFGITNGAMYECENIGGTWTATSVFAQAFGEKKVPSGSALSNWVVFGTIGSDVVLYVIEPNGYARAYKNGVGLVAVGVVDNQGLFTAGLVRE